MLFFTLAFLTGDACLLFLKTLPALAWLLSFLLVNLLGLLILPAFFKRWLFLSAAFLAGLAWSTFSAHRLLNNTLPADYFNQSIVLTGTIDAIPEAKDPQVNFTIQAEQIANNTNIFKKPIRIRLSWYFAPREIRAGQTWQLSVRLKKPANYGNAGSFDYQQWLFEQRIVAVGYVQANKNNHLIKDFHPFKFIDIYRENIANNIKNDLNGKATMGLIQALAVGVRNNITEAQWAVMRATGTNHLFAIAGLHIGFVAGFTYFLVGFVWRRLGRLPLYFPTPLACALAALLSAIIYSALAGFSLPTQRAIIMTTVFLLATVFRRKIPLWHAWSLALILVLIYDPLTVLSASFWMSFGAVALIIYGISGRLYKKNIWRHWLYPQWVIAIGLIPICLLFFQQCSLIGFIANAIAIPWLGFLVLPFSLAGGILSTLWPAAAKLLLLPAEYLLGLLWAFLSAITKLSWLQWHTYITNPFILISALIAVAILLSPRGIPGRWLGILWAMPLLLWQPPGPKLGVTSVTVLNVGAGIAAIIRTHSHVLIYESSLKPGVNSTIVLPYLQYSGIKQIDQLIINTPAANNLDTFNLLALLPVKQVYTNTTDNNAQGNIALCGDPVNWQWDQINFTIKNLSNNKHDICALTINQNTLITDATILDSPIANSDVQANVFITTYKNNKPNLLTNIQQLHPQFLILSTQQITDFTHQLANTKIYSTAEQGMINIQWINNQAKPLIYGQAVKKHIWNQ